MKYSQGGNARFSINGKGFRRSDPPLTRWSFWAIQLCVAGLAVLHIMLESSGLRATLGGLDFIPLSLFWIPVTVSAFRFGSTGAIVTAVLVIIANIPNFVLSHQGVDRTWEISEVVVIVSVALFVGFIADQKKAALDRARLYAESSLHTREEERRRISRDIHDDTVQSMIAACRQIDGIRYLNKDIPSNIDEDLKSLRHSMEGTVARLRDLTREIRPHILDEFGMIASIKRLLKDLESRLGIRTEFKVTGEAGNMSGFKEAGIYRIAQEAIRNAANHSDATAISVTLTFNPKQAQIEVRDNGKGFELPETPDHFVSAGHFGMIGMFEYAELMGGFLEIESGDDKGTTVSATIPVSSGEGRND